MLAILAGLSLLTFSLLPLNYGLYALFLNAPRDPRSSLDRPDTVRRPRSRARHGRRRRARPRGRLPALGDLGAAQSSQDVLGEVAGALRAFVRAALDAYLGVPNDATLRAAAAHATLTVGNAESALQRLMTEPRRRRGDLASVLAFVGAAHRLRLEASALALHASHLSGSGTLQALGPLAAQIERRSPASRRPCAGARCRRLRSDSTRRSARCAIRSRRCTRSARRSSARGRPARRLVGSLSDVALAAREIARMAGNVAALHAAATRVATDSSTGRAA